MSSNVLANSLSACIRASVLGLVWTVTLSGVASAQPPEQSPYEQIQALDRRSVELLKNLSKHGEAQSLAQQALDIAERSSGADSAESRSAWTISPSRYVSSTAMTKPSLCSSVPFLSGRSFSVATAPTYVRA